MGKSWLRKRRLIPIRPLKVCQAGRETPPLYPRLRRRRTYSRLLPSLALIMLRTPVPVICRQHQQRIPRLRHR
jgi:hypothetical protein